MHGFTQTHNPQELLQNSLTITKLYLACGVNLDHTLIYNPALIPAHAQLYYGNDGENAFLQGSSRKRKSW